MKQAPALNSARRIKWPSSSMRRAAYPALAFFLILALSGCSKGYPRSFNLPEDPPASSLGWAAVRTAYAKVRAEPSGAAAERGIVRIGTVFVLRERKIDPEGLDIGGFWYRFSDAGISGWLNGEDLSIFSSEEQALSAAKILSSE